MFMLRGENQHSISPGSDEIFNDQAPVDSDEVIKEFGSLLRKMSGDTSPLEVDVEHEELDSWSKVGKTAVSLVKDSRALAVATNKLIVQSTVSFIERPLQVLLKIE